MINACISKLLWICMYVSKIQQIGTFAGDSGAMLDQNQWGLNR